MGDMSEDQEKALEQFRKYIKDNSITDHPQYDDYYLLRFLRARKFDMEKTILMFTTFMSWRKENDVDNILEVRHSLPNQFLDFQFRGVRADAGGVSSLLSQDRQEGPPRLH